MIIVKCDQCGNPMKNDRAVRFRVKDCMVLVKPWGRSASGRSDMCTDCMIYTVKNGREIPWTEEEKSKGYNQPSN